MIVHFVVSDKFIEPFISFIENHFNSKEHIFVLCGIDTFNISKRKAVIKLDIRPFTIGSLLTYIKYLNKAEQIFLHGLFDSTLLVLLALQPHLLKKCYWIMWGGDLYCYQTRNYNLTSIFIEQVKKKIIKKFGHFVTYVKGDYELAQKWYGAKGQYHNCLMYPSNLYNNVPLSNKIGKTFNILIGNSADFSNNHLEIFYKLEKYKEKDINIYCPLSYGDKEYAKTIVKAGNDLFGDKFIPLLDYMPFEKYLVILSQIDIAMFAHKRQQAMGNIITLLGLGKKVFIRSDISSWSMFKEIGIAIYDINEFELRDADQAVMQQNVSKIRAYFSESTLRLQWEQLLVKTLD